MPPIHIRHDREDTGKQCSPYQPATKLWSASHSYLIDVLHDTARHPHFLQESVRVDVFIVRCTCSEAVMIAADVLVGFSEGYTIFVGLCLV